MIGHGEGGGARKGRIAGPVVQRANRAKWPRPHPRGGGSVDQLSQLWSNLLPVDDQDRLGAAPTLPTTPLEGTAGEGRVAVGDCLGRYTVKARLGAGGMGEVYVGHDPELDRDVALKVLRPGFAGPSPESRARFQREAQAMAKLNHPNVVVVYDVGAIGEQVFIAMELVRGPTLASWIADGPHGWREVVDVFVQAGRGLEAAHAADIVHRDFKPANVILGDDRVRVADFGLARSFGESDPATRQAAGTLLDQTLTQTGGAVGTPKYMAPEQREGRAVGALADQFAFCVALDEALVGARVPRSISALVARGMEPDPEKRFPSMTALLAELGRDRARLRRFAFATLGVIALAGSGVVAMRLSRAEPCADPSGRIAAAWDPARKAAVHAAFIATNVPYAEDSWRTVSGVIDRYAASWIDEADAACRATRVESRQSDTLMDLRMACLDQKKAVLADLTALWSRGMDAAAIEQATAGVTKLPSLAPCADARALTEQPKLPDNQVQATQVRAVRKHLEAIQALVIAHRTADVKREAEAARVEAAATNWPLVRAEVAFEEARVLNEIADSDAEARLDEAARFAAEANDERLRSHALILLIENLARIKHQGERALTIADIVDPAVHRLGDRVLEADYLRARSDALIQLGKLAEARKALDRARTLFPADDPQTLSTMRLLADLAESQGDYAASKKLGQATLDLAIKLFGASHPRVGRAYVTLGNAEAQLGDYDAAIDHFRRGLAIVERQSGSGGTQAGQVLMGLGGAELMRGRAEDARVDLERAVAILEQTTGSDSVLVAGALDNLAESRLEDGRLGDAIATLERSLAIKSARLGPTHGDLLLSLQNLAIAVERSGDVNRATALYHRAIDIARAALGADHPQTYAIEGGLGAVLARQHRCAEAKPWLTKAIAKLGAAEEPLQDLGPILAGAGNCELTANPASALALLDRALGVVEPMKLSGDEVGPIRWLRVQALAALHRSDEARKAARQARTELAESKITAGELAQVDAWLARQP